MRINSDSRGGGGGGPGFGRGRGGRGGFERADVAPDGSYKIDGLAPGSYLVRAWTGEQQDIMRQLMPMFMSGELQPDVTVKGGETSRLDLDVTTAQLGTVSGTVLENGNPAKGYRVELTSLANPNNDYGQGGGGPGGRGGFGRGGRGGWRGQEQATVTGSGTFKIERVNAGEYTLRVQTDDRTTVHEENVFVVADAVTERHISIRTASLSGSVTVDGVEAKDISGSITLLAGLDAMPDDYREWRRTPGNTTINGRVRDGRFEVKAVPPGNYLLVLNVRGREPTSAPIVVGDGKNETSIAAGAVAPAGANPGPGAPGGAANRAGGGNRNGGGNRTGGGRRGGR